MKARVPWCLEVVLFLLCLPLLVLAQPDIAPVPPKAEVDTERLLVLLTNEHPDVRAQAAARFAEIYELQWFDRPDQMIYADMKTRLLVEAALIGLFQHDPVPAVRRASALTLGQLKLDKAVEVLAGALKDTDPGARAAAALGLGYLEDPRAVQPLTVLLADPKAPDRALAIEVLCGYGDLELAAPVAGLLNDPAPDIRTAAILNLASLKQPEVNDPLLGLLTHADPETRGEAARLLGEIGETRAVPQLTVMLQEQETAPVIGALQGLAALKDAASFDAVLAVATTHPDDEVRREAIRTLCTCNSPRSADALLDVVKKTRDVDEAVWAAMFLRDLQYPNFDRILQTLLTMQQDQDATVRHIANRTLVSIEDPRVLEQQLALVHDPDPQMRGGALNNLGEYSDPRVLPLLITTLGDPDPDIYDTVKREIHRSRDERAQEMLAALLADKNPVLRARAAEVMALRLSEGFDEPAPQEAAALRAALGKLLAEKDPTVCLQAACALGRLHDQRAFRVLKPLAQSPDALTRDAAIYGLAGLSDLPSMQLVVAAFNDREAGVRGDARWYLEDAIRNRGEALAPLLPQIIEDADEATFQSLLLIVRETESPAVGEALLNSPRVEFRRAAIHALAEWFQTEGAEDVLVAALQDRDARVRAEAAGALGKTANKQHVASLLRLQHDPDPDVRRAVEASLAALAQLKDPDPVEVRTGELVVKKPEEIDPIFEKLRAGKAIDSQAEGALAGYRHQHIVEMCLALLTDERADLRTAAARILAYQEDPRAVGPLIVALRDPDAGVSVVAIRALSKLRYFVHGWPPLFAETGKLLLADDDALRRRIGVNVLGLVGDPALAGLLIDSLKDTDTEVRRASVEALGGNDYRYSALNCRESLVVTALLAAGQDRDAGMRNAAVISLAGYDQDPRVVEPLCAALTGTNRDMPSQILDALGDIRDPRMTAALVKLYRGAGDDTYLKERAVNHLARCMDAALTKMLLADLPNADQGLRYAITQALLSSREPGVMAALLADARRQVAGKDPEQLGGITSPRELIIPTQFQESCQPMLQRIYWHDAASVDMLLAAVANDSQELRLVIMPVLAERRSARAVPVLLKCMADQDPLVRRAALQALGIIGDIRALEPALAALNDADPKLQATAALALGRLGDAHAVEPLLAKLASPNADVLFTTVHALGMLKDARACDAVLALLKHPDAGVRARVAWTMGELLDAYATGPLLAAMRDDDVALRAAAIEALGKFAAAHLAPDVTKQAVEPLLALINDTPTSRGDPNAPKTVLYKSVITTLGQLEDPRAIDPLIEILRTREYTFAQPAVKALGHFHETRVVQALLETNLSKTRAFRQVEEALAAMGPVAREPLLAALQDADPDKCAIAQVTFQKMAESQVPLDDRVRTALLASVDDASKWSAYAAFALIALHDLHMADKLLPRMPKNTIDSNNDWIIDVLCTAGDLRVLDTLRQVLASSAKPRYRGRHGVPSPLRRARLPISRSAWASPPSHPHGYLTRDGKTDC